MLEDYVLATVLAGHVMLTAIERSIDIFGEAARRISAPWSSQAKTEEARLFWSNLKMIQETTYTSSGRGSQTPPVLHHGRCDILLKQFDNSRYSNKYLWAHSLCVSAAKMLSRLLCWNSETLYNGNIRYRKGVSDCSEIPSFLLK